jgi:hypothetical protein
LTPCAKKVLEPFFKDLNLNNIVLDEDGIPIYVPGKHNAYTEWNHIYFDSPGGRSTLDQRTVVGLALIAHELVHTRQYQRYSYAMIGTLVVGFPGLYLIDAARVKKNGGDPGGPDNIYENEAYDEEARILNTLKETYKDKNGIACP